MKIPAQSVFDTHITRIEQCADTARQFFFSAPQTFSYKPGQYIWVELPFSGFGRASRRRAFSICNAPGDTHDISILSRQGKSDYKKKLFSLAVGDMVRIHGAFGNSFVINTATAPQRLVLIAGGVGIAAFLPLLESIGQRSAPTQYFLYYLNTRPSSTPCLPALQELQKRFPQFQYTVSYKKFSWRAIPKSDVETQWWISGPQGMVDFVSGHLTKKGVPLDHMRFEQFYPTPKHNLRMDQIQTYASKEGILTQAIQNSTNHTIITDANGIILFANKAVEDITGYEHDEIIGNSPRLWGGTMPPSFYKNFWLNKKKGAPFQGEIINRKKDGRSYYTIAHITPLFDKRRTSVIGYIGTEEDVTSIRAREEAHRVLNRRFALATASARIGIWDWDADQDLLVWDDRMYEIYGVYGEKKMNTYADWQRLIHPDDRAGHDEMLRSARKTGRVGDSIFRIVHPNGDVHHIHGYGVIERTQFHTKMIGVNIDVTHEMQLDMAKSEFVSIASHQLRTPLTSLRLFSEMLIRGEVGKLKPEQQEYIQIISDSTKRLILLVNGLLNVSRIEAGRIRICPEPVSLDELLRSIITEVQPTAEAKTCKIIFDPPKKKQPPISLDPLLSREIIANIITNGIKYAASTGGIVTIRLSRTAKLPSSIHKRRATKNTYYTVVHVQDNGIGIPAALQHRIGEKFFRTDNAVKTAAEGSGLGLYVSKKLAEEMGGDLWFESREGRGSIFSVAFPESGAIARQGDTSLAVTK